VLADSLAIMLAAAAFILLGQGVQPKDAVTRLPKVAMI